MKNCKSRGTGTPVYEYNTPMPPVKPAKAEEKVFYLCDRRACEKCSPNCKHTTDVRHAADFRVKIDGSIWQDDGETVPELFADDIDTGRTVIRSDQIVDGTYSG